MVGGVEDYLSQMDRLLVAGCFFPDGTALPAPAAETGAEAPASPAGGALGEAVGQAGAGYRAAGTRIGALEDAIGQAVGEALAEVQRGRQTATAILATARSQAAAVAEAARDPEGLGLLVSGMEERLAAMQAQIRSSRAQMQEAAGRVRRHSAELANIRPA